jgi:hypothetical protein
MDRRAYLGGVASVASLLAGCSSSEGGRATPTVTPAPIPAGGSDPVGELDPATLGDAQVDALSGGSARVAVEYKAGRQEQPFDLARIIATVDGGALTYRVFAIRELEFGAFTRAESTRSVHLEPNDLTPPSPADRFDRDRLVALLSAFRPSVTDGGDGDAVTAESMADPARLPTPPRSGR